MENENKQEVQVGKMPVISVQHACKSFGKQQVLKDVSGSSDPGLLFQGPLQIGRASCRERV